MWMPVTNRRNPWDPNGTNDHTIHPDARTFFGGGQVASLLGGMGGGMGGGGGMMPQGPGRLGGAPGVGSGNALFDSIQKSIDAANNANNQRYGQALGTVDSGKNQMMEMIKQMYGQILGGGAGAIGDPTAALARNEQQRQAEGGKTQTYLADRGLGNSTIASNMLGGVDNEANIRGEEIRTGAAKDAAGYKQQQLASMLDVLGNWAREKTGVISSKTDNGPDLGMIAQLLSQPGAGGQGTGPNNALLQMLMQRRPQTVPGLAMGSFQRGGGGAQGTGGFQQLGYRNLA